MKLLSTRFVSVAVLVVAAAMGASAQNPANLHLACYTGADGVQWQVSSDDSGTTLTRTATDGSSSSKHTDVVPTMPASGSQWEQGKEAANVMVHEHFFPMTKKIGSATWAHNDYSRADVFNFTDKSGAWIAFQSTSCSGWNNCAGAGGASGKHCFTQYEDCCGYGTMSPQCTTKGSGDQCCTWYLSSATCNSTQSCCGMQGPGASSYAFCCNEGSTCCTAQVGYDGWSTCCPEGSTCCQGSSIGLCCAAGDVCNPSMNRCDKPAPPTSTTTTTAAPTAAPMTAAPPVSNCPSWGSTNGPTCTADQDCCGYGTMSPQCVDKDAGKQCCQWFKAATTCNSTQSCCGMMGPGASSYAFCCNEGSSCCQAQSATSGTSSCCPAGTTCCAGSGIGLCCGADEVCNASMNRCDKASSSSTTAAP